MRDTGPNDDDPAAWLLHNPRAFALRDGGDLLLTARRPIAGFAELTAAERRDLFDLLGALGVAEGAVRFDLRAPAGARWHIRVSPAPAAFAGLPGFVGGEDEHLLPALRAGLGRAESADLLAAFVQPLGVELLRGDLEDALRRGARVRVLTGDYLGITDPAALRRLCELAEEHAGLEAAIYRCDDRESFHAKAYIFVAGDEATAYVGSSNLSGPALREGVEWNLRALAGADAGELRAIRARFERLWRAPKTARLDHAWIDAYAARRPASASASASALEPPPDRPTPHAIQARALAALSEAQERGDRRGLVVLATGLGKTLLAAFAAAQMGARRVLFVAHREEILLQARRAFARVLPEASSGLFDGKRRERGAALVFASVQTLARREHLQGFAAGRFDLIVVDEFHHAAAATYRRILEHFAPRFLLGVTATPERSDGGELLALCDDNLVFRAGIREGIEVGRLVPFTYFGVRDAVDYQAIPWRSGRFDPEALGQALATRAHADAVLARYREHAPAGPRRGLWFCASIQHAAFMAGALRAAGIAAVAVHSGAGGAPRSESLRRLAAGELEAITTVDVFNEGVDVPDVNVVVLLRPTDSRVVFLQQIGRGLRLGERAHKPRLVILDVIGNHRSFLRKPQALAGLLGRELSGRAAARALQGGELPLPEGCSVELEEVRELLERVGGEGSGDAIAAIFDRLRDALDRRPRLAELADAGAQVRAAAREFGSWWDLLDREGALDEDEARVLGSRRAALVALERARAHDPAVWGALRAWIAAGGVDAPVAEAELPALEGGASAAGALAALWPEGLVLRGGALGLREAAADEDVPVLEDMIDEIAEARRLDRQRRSAAVAPGGGLPCQVKLNSGKPHLRFTRTDATPTGMTEVWALGEPYRFKFVKIAVNAAYRGDDADNVLPELLRRIFGADAGANGTDHRVLLREVDGRWVLTPLGDHLAEVVTLPFYPALAVACGLGDVAHGAADEASTVAVRTARVVDPRRHFVVRARGDSMKGGPRPIADGDLVLCERVVAPAPGDVTGRACLLVAASGPDASEAMIKAPVLEGGAWRLRSWSKGQEDLPIDRWEALTVVARVLEVVPPA